MISKNKATVSPPGIDIDRGIEKNDHRYLIKEINKHYQSCELIDFIPDIAYFNTWYFPNETKKSASKAN